MIPLQGHIWEQICDEISFNHGLSIRGQRLFRLALMVLREHWYLGRYCP